LVLNVNQKNFENLPKASSLASICNATFNKEEIILKIVEEMEKNIRFWNKNKETFRLDYINRLFKKGIPMPFTDPNQQNFMGIIQGISPIGKLEILLEDDSVSEFDIKEIQMLY
jgi:BirA family biotin operon repressor/biotin-[acetyl-CoA-carboxylase] ligase